MANRWRMFICAALVAGSATSCIPARAGARCRTTELGRDATHVLQCEGGRWARVMTLADAARFLAAAQPTTTTTTATAAPGRRTSPAILPYNEYSSPDLSQTHVTDMSSNGRWITGSSEYLSTGLPGAPYGTPWVHDTTSRNYEATGYNDSYRQAVSDDGRYVAYATNRLAPDGFTSRPVVSVVDRFTGVDTQYGPGIVLDLSFDGRVLANFDSTTPITRVVDRTTGVAWSTSDIGPFNEAGSGVLLSGNGEWVTVRDANSVARAVQWRSNTSRAIGIQPNGTVFPGPVIPLGITYDGNLVLFDFETGDGSRIDHHLYLRDMATGKTIAVTAPGETLAAPTYDASLAPDGSAVAFACDADRNDLCVYRPATRTTEFEFGRGGFFGPIFITSEPNRVLDAGKGWFLERVGS